MKRFTETCIERNYTKRILAILIAAAVLLAAVAVLVPVTLRRQIAEFRTLEEEREQQKKQTEQTQPDAGREERKKASHERELKAILRQLTPIGTGTKLAFAAVALLALLLGIFYWVTVAEWLYKTAVLHGLNRALWPMLGLLFNVLTLPVLLVVLYDPKRMARQEQ